MKTAYEIAMERLAKGTPVRTLTDDQRRQLAELDSRYAAKIAERDIFLRAELDKAEAGGDAEKAQQLREQLARERQALQAELEEKKEKVRQGG